VHRSNIGRSIIRVIPANPAFPVRPKSGHSANDPCFYEYAP
jgi:hypothetical protein